MLFIIN